MTDKISAAKLLAQLARQYGPIFALAPDIEKLGSLDAIAEATSGRISVLKSAEADLNTRVADLRKQATQAVQDNAAAADKVAGEIADKQKSADDYVTQKESEGNELVAKARDTAADIVANANTRAEQVEAVLQAKITDLENVIRERKSSLVSVETDLNERKAQLSAVKQQAAQVAAG